MSARSAPRVVIVGAGITGLTAAYAIKKQRPDFSVTLLEKRERAGGNIVTQRENGFLLDGGPDSFLATKREGAELCRELGLENELIRPRPEGRKVYMVHDGRLEPMPAGLALAIPTQIGPMLRTPLLSFPGKIRMLGDLMIRPRSSETDESVEAFIARHFGKEAARRLAAPLLGGIYAGDVGELSIRSTFPQLIDIEKKHGSLVRGFVALQAERAKNAQGKRGEAPSPFISLARGMGSLVTALTESLAPGTLKTGRAVRGLERMGTNGYAITVEGGERFETDAVLLASPAHASARMLFDRKLADELQAIPYLSTATVFFAFPAAQMPRPLDASGFVAPKGESDLIAGTWITSKWDARAPEGHVLLRAFLGGVRTKVDIAGSSDEQLSSIAKRDLERLMGPLGSPEFTRVFRYVDSNPQPIVGHGARLSRIDERLSDLGGLFLAGAAYDGVGIPDCVRQARAVAAKIVDRLSTISA